jgi:hypothetical protein
MLPRRVRPRTWHTPRFTLKPSLPRCTCQQGHRTVAYRFTGVVFTVAFLCPPDIDHITRPMPVAKHQEHSNPRCTPDVRAAQFHPRASGHDIPRDLILAQQRSGGDRKSGPPKRLAPARAAHNTVAAKRLFGRKSSPIEAMNANSARYTITMSLYQAR